MHDAIAEDELRKFHRHFAIECLNHAAHYEQAKTLGAALHDEERSYFDAVFRTIPSVAGE